MDKLIVRGTHAKAYPRWGVPSFVEGKFQDQLTSRLGGILEAARRGAKGLRMGPDAAKRSPPSGGEESSKARSRLSRASGDAGMAAARGGSSRASDEDDVAELLAMLDAEMRAKAGSVDANAAAAEPAVSRGGEGASRTAREAAESIRATLEDQKKERDKGGESAKGAGRVRGPGKSR